MLSPFFLLYIVFSFFFQDFPPVLFPSVPHYFLNLKRKEKKTRIENETQQSSSFAIEDQHTANLLQKYCYIKVQNTYGMTYRLEKKKSISKNMKAIPMIHCITCQIDSRCRTRVL